MERVQFQQEQMLAELKDLVQKGLFTTAETKQIMKKRTAFETALVRRVAKKSDFVRYTAYEMGLEQLRRKRLERLHLPPSPPSVSDYALVRRQFHIFERALKKFKSDVGLWIQYIQVAKREGAPALVGRITARALQLHPHTPALYILAASHELSHLSPSAARTLLQRGIRLNADSVDIWREYVKMELGFIEGLRRRWDVLGIVIAEDGKGKEKALELPMDLDGDGSMVEQIQVDGDVQGKDEDEDKTRKAIMDGAIVKSVMSSAATALPKTELFISLHNLIVSYPSPPSLRESLLDHLLNELRTTLPDEPLGLKLSATRSLKPDVDGENLVEALKIANENLLAGLKHDGKNGESFLRLYADFVEEWCRPEIDVNLRLYLISSLRLLVSQQVSPSLYSSRIRLLISPSNPTAPSPAKVLKLARRYTSEIPRSAEVWLARLAVEKHFSTREEVEQAWSDARNSVVGTADEVEDVWMWGLAHYTGDGMEERLRVHEQLLQESMRDSSRSGLHETLLMQYATLHVDGNNSKLLEERCLHKMAAEYFATARVWAKVFSLQVENGAEHKTFQEIYEMWREKDLIEATIAWGRWLLMNGRGKEATAVVVRARSSLKGPEWAELEKRWAVTLDEERGVVEE